MNWINQEVTDLIKYQLDKLEAYAQGQNLELIITKIELDRLHIVTYRPDQPVFLLGFPCPLTIRENLTTADPAAKDFQIHATFTRY